MTNQFWARVLCPLPLSSMIELCNAAPKGSYVRNIGQVSFEGITREVLEIGPEIPGEAIPQRTARLFADAAQLELRLHNLLDDLQGPLDLDLEGRITALHERVFNSNYLEEALQLQLNEYGVPHQNEKGTMDLSERLEWIFHAGNVRYEAAIVGLKQTSEQRDKAREERDQLHAGNVRLCEINDELRNDEKRLLVERDEARAEANRLTGLVKTLTHQLEVSRSATQRFADELADLRMKHTRPEPSRLEIAAMIYAAWEANPEIELVRQTGSDRAACFEPCGAVLEADALIAAVEGRCNHDSH